jgi:hypothetical protein
LDKLTRMPSGRVVTRTIEEGRTNGWTMAAGSSVTWMHCSVCYKVTSGVNRRVRVDTPLRPLRPAPSPCPPCSSYLRADGLHLYGRELRPRGRTDASAWTRLLPPAPLARSLPPASLPSLVSARTGYVHVDPSASTWTQCGCSKKTFKK